MEKIESKIQEQQELLQAHQASRNNILARKICREKRRCRKYDSKNTRSHSRFRNTKIYIQSDETTRRNLALQPIFEWKSLMDLSCNSSQKIFFRCPITFHKKPTALHCDLFGKKDIKKKILMMEFDWSKVTISEKNVFSQESSSVDSKVMYILFEDKNPSVQKMLFTCLIFKPTFYINSDTTFTICKKQTSNQRNILE